MRRAGIALLLAGLGPNAANAAEQANCALTLINTIPVTMADESRRPLISVTINGAQKKFLLDTGGAITQISAETAEALKLPVEDGPVKMLDLYGNASTKAARVNSFGLGRQIDNHAIFPIMTFRENELYSGIFAADYMGRYDIELDFAGGKMNYFSLDHCRGKVVYWPAVAVAVVPMLFRYNHLILDVSLDGHPLRAIIDTGAPGTTLPMAEARRAFGIKAEDRDKEFEHTFQKLSFEGLEVSNPHVSIMPDKVGKRDPNNDLVTGSRVRRIDDADPTDPTMLIGMNILSKLRLYIAFSENKIYITPASRPQSAPASAATISPAP